MASTTPSRWWAPDVHADRLPFLLARNRVQAALRAYLAGGDFIEVDTPALQISPGNETHLHAFKTELIGSDGKPRDYYLHTSPEFACKKLLSAAKGASSPSPMSIAIARPRRPISLSSPCSNGIASARPIRR
jgi:lysyl-tRNA synthetase class 2